MLTLTTSMGEEPVTLEYEDYEYTKARRKAIQIGKITNHRIRITDENNNLMFELTPNLDPPTQPRTKPYKPYKFGEHSYEQHHTANTKP